MSATGTSPAGEAKGPMLAASGGFARWMSEQAVSCAATTYQAGRLIFIGQRPDGALRGHERMIEHRQGLWTDGTSLWRTSVRRLVVAGNVESQNLLGSAAPTGHSIKHHSSARGVVAL